MYFKLNNREFENNYFTGSISPEFGGLTFLQNLYNSSLYVLDIFLSFFRLLNSKKKRTDNDYFSGTIPTQIGSLSNLQAL